jgi:hypothetical protein
MKLLRSILKFLGIFISSILLLLIGIYLFANANPQQSDVVNITGPITKSFEKQKDSIDIEALKAEFGKNKVLLPGYELPILLALQYFPELKDAHISFEFTQKGAPMESSFGFASLLRNAKHRQYRILLNDSKGSMFDPILLRSLPFEGQVGIFAHELGHTMYYHDMNLFQIGKWAMKYVLDNNFRKIHERSTDALAIYRGAGWQLYDYTYYTRHDESTQHLVEGFAEFIDFYMSPEDIMELIKSIKEYE